MVFADSLEGKTPHVCTGRSGTQGKAISLRQQKSVLGKDPILELGLEEGLGVN